MRNNRYLSAATLFAVLAFGHPAAISQPMFEQGVLLTETRLALYTFDNDVAGSGKSVCNAPCSNIFPPYLVKGTDTVTADFSVVVRQDGSKQWAYKGRPLYTFYNDKAGDKGGDGLNRNLWHLVRE